MNEELFEKIKILMKRASEIWKQGGSVNVNDPVIRLIMLAVLSETTEIKDRIELSDNKIAELLRDEIIPYNLIQARPSLSVLEVKPNEKIQNAIMVDDTFDFVHEKKGKTFNFKPLIETKVFSIKNKYQKNFPHTICYGIEIGPHIKSIAQVSFLLENPALANYMDYIDVSLSINGKEIPVVKASDTRAVELCSVFKERYPNNSFFGDPQYLKELLAQYAPNLYYIPAGIDLDISEEKTLYPSCIESVDKNLPGIPNEELLWLEFRINHIHDSDIRKTEIKFNCVPVVNVNVEQVMLDTSNPAAKLKDDINSSFINLLYDEAWKSYKPELPFIVRNMLLERFSPSDMQKQIERLFDRFNSDYFAFKGMKGLRDGVKLNVARKIINELYVSSQEEDLPEYEGYYALLNMSVWNKKEPVAVKYLCSNCEAANHINIGDKAIVINPNLHKESVFLTNCRGGKNRAKEKDKKHIARYQVLTKDRLITQEDIRAFCYKELGDNLQSVSVHRGAVAGTNGLCRGIVVTLYPKKTAEKKPPEYYVSLSGQLEKKIAARSANVFPVKVQINKN